MEEKSEQTLHDLLQRQSKEALIAFLAEHAEHNADFLHLLHVHFRSPVLDDELRGMMDRIDDALASVSDYRAHNSWGYINFDISDIVAEIMQRTQQGHIRLAFAQAELLYRKLLECFEHQGECEISDAAENCLGIMSEISEKAVLSEDKEYIFEQCIALCDLEDGKDYGADYEDKLLSIAAKFVTSQNLDDLENALALFDSGWREEAFTLIRLEIVRKIKGEEAANAFIAENLQFPQIREIAFDHALARNDVKEAERLCLDALSLYEQHYGISPWLHKLYAVYEAMGNVARQSEIAREILLLGNMDYYDKLKALLENQGAWGDTYIDLCRQCESKLSYTQYMEVLAKEEEHGLLLEQLKKHMELVYLYGELLASDYPDSILAIAAEQIRHEAQKANQRERYREVCGHIPFLRKIDGEAAALALIEELKVTYKRKPAFVDELKQITI